MDQIRIGRFIAQCRKTGGLTQRQLADGLGISDKTVSKWECGNGLPEVSLMLPLCEALGITVNDLLSGERVAQADYQKKAEENMMELIRENAENKKRLALSLICAAITGIAVCALIALAAFANAARGRADCTDRSGPDNGRGGRRGRGRAGRESRLLSVPALQGDVYARPGRICQGIPHLYPAQAGMPRLRQDGPVQAAHHQVGGNKDRRGTLWFPAVCSAVRRQRIEQPAPVNFP